MSVLIRLSLLDGVDHFGWNIVNATLKLAGVNQVDFLFLSPGNPNESDRLRFIS